MKFYALQQNKKIKVIFKIMVSFIDICSSAMCNVDNIRNLNALFF